VDNSATDVSAPNRDEPLGLQDAKRLAERRLADPELVEQVLLPGEHVSIAKRAARDPVSEGAGDELGQAWLPKLAATVLAQLGTSGGCLSACQIGSGKAIITIIVTSARTYQPASCGRST
jgi:hypothetical protein